MKESILPRMKNATQETVLGGIAEHINNGKMLIVVGEPGEGKTTLLLDFIKLYPKTVRYHRCTPNTTMRSILRFMAGCVGVKPAKDNDETQDRISNKLRSNPNIIFAFDEVEYLACTNTWQIDVLRQIYDDTGAPMIICGTYELYDLLTGEDSRHMKYSHNKPQISRRLRKEEFEKIQEHEIDCYLSELEQYYAVRFEPPVRAKLISICSDRMNGGLGNFIEVLELLFSTERPEWEEISYQIIRDTNRILHTHSDPIQIPSYVVCEDQPSEKSMDVFAEECDPPAEDPHPRIDVTKLPVVTITRSSINDALRHKMGR